MMTKIVLYVLCLIVAAFAILSNNLVSNAYAQELQCPEINGFTLRSESSESVGVEGETMYCDYYFEYESDSYTMSGYSNIGFVYLIDVESYRAVKLHSYNDNREQTCWEYNQDKATDYGEIWIPIKSETHYAITYFSVIESSDTPSRFFESTKNAAINLLHEIEGSGLAASCEFAEFQFNIDVPVFSTVKQGDPVRIPVKVTLVKGEPKEVALSTTTFQESLGIYGWFETSTVTPTQRTYLVVQTSCITPPDNYQFYANGIATSGDVPASSTDMVTITVEAKPGCVSSQNNQQLGQQPVISGSTSESLDSAYQLVTQGKYQEALPYLDSVLQQEPDNVDALYGKAYALNYLEKYEDTLSTINQVLALDPNYAGAYFEKGYALGHLGRYEESIKAYKNELQIDPNDKNALLNIGWTLNQLGRYEEAVIYFDKTLTIDPNYVLAQENKEYSLAKINEQEVPEPFDQGGGCLIATATFGSELAPQVQFLREVRDNTVLSTASGTSFMTAFNTFYYSFSPTVADWERQNPVFKEAVNLTITPLITTLSLLQYVDIDSETEMLGYGISIILLNVGMYFVAPTVAIVKVGKLFKNKIR